MSTGFWLSYGLLWALVVFALLLMLGVVNASFGRTAQAAGGGGPADASHQLGPFGMPAPAVVATDIHGDIFARDDWAGRRTALLWVSPDCLSCKLTLPELDALHRKVNGNLLVVCSSVRGRCAQMAEEYGLNVPVLVDEEGEVGKLFGVDIAPTAVVIDAGGRIEMIGHPLSGDDLERLIARRTGGAVADTPAPGITVIGPE